MCESELPQSSAKRDEMKPIELTGLTLIAMKSVQCQLNRRPLHLYRRLRLPDRRRGEDRDPGSPSRRVRPRVCAAGHGGRHGSALLLLLGEGQEFVRNLHNGEL